MAERGDIDRKHTHWSVDNTWCVRVDGDSVFCEVKRFMMIIIIPTTLVIKLCLRGQTQRYDTNQILASMPVPQTLT